MLDDYSDCQTCEQVHEKLKANFNNYFDQDSCKQLCEYGKQYIQHHKKPKDIPALLDLMERNDTLQIGCYDILKKLVQPIDKRILYTIRAAEEAILKIRNSIVETTKDTGMASIQKTQDPHQQEDAACSLRNKLCEDKKPKKIKKLLKELQNMVEIMPKDIKEKYSNLKEVTSNKKGQFTTIIIAGETCAGKTTLVNLFIESDLFRDSNSPSTSAIVFLHYDEKYRIKVYAKEKKEDKRKLKFKAHDISPSELKRHVEEYTCTKSQVMTKKPIICVHVYYPAQILENGIVIVDTPSFRGLEAVSDYFEEVDHHTLAHVFVMNASCSNLSESKTGEYIPTFLCQLLKCAERYKSIEEGEIIFLVNKWDSVMTTGQDTGKFMDDSWFDIKHIIITTLANKSLNRDNIYRVSLGKQMRQESDERLHMEFCRFVECVYGILNRRNTDIQSELSDVAKECRSIVEKKLEKIKKEDNKRKKYETDLKGNLTKLERVWSYTEETEESDSELDDCQEKSLSGKAKKRRRELDK